MCRKVALSWPIATLFLYPHFRRIYGSSSTGRFLWPRFTFVLYLLRFMAHSMDWLLLTHWNLILKLWNYSGKKISSRGIWQKIGFHATKFCACQLLGIASKQAGFIPLISNHFHRMCTTATLLSTSLSSLDQRYA